MGGKYSVLADPKFVSGLDHDSGDAYFALALLEPNRICLVHAGTDVVGVIQKTLRGDRSSTSQAQNDDFVQKECKKEDGSYEFELRGKPFSKFAGRSTALKIKRLLCQLVADLYLHGWDLCVASDLTTDDYHTTWFFRQSLMSSQGSARIGSKIRIVSLSLSGGDGLTLINAPERLRKALIDAVRFGYTYGTESEDMFEEDLEIKLNGGPWETSMLEEGIWARKLLLEIFRQFSKCKFSYYAVADTKGTADSIFFIQQQTDTMLGKRNPHGHCEDDNKKICVTREISESSIGHFRERRRSSCCVMEDVKITLKPNPLSDSKDQLSVACQPPRRGSWQELAATNAAPEAYPLQIEQFFMVSLNRTDSLRLIDAPKSVRDIIKNLITQHWPYGLQRETKYEMAYEFRLNRSPWAASGGDAVAAHSFLTLLFEHMLSEGWKLLATLDMSRRRNDKSVFILKKDPPTKSVVHRHHFCVSMTDGDKIRIIRGDDHVITLIKQVVKEHWPYGIQREREYHGASELQLVGHPWLNLPGRCNEPLSARVMLLEMLREFHEHRWRVIVSADISGRYQTPANVFYNPVSVDSWIVAKEGDDGCQVIKHDTSHTKSSGYLTPDMANGNERDKK